MKLLVRLCLSIIFVLHSAWALADAKLNIEITEGVDGAAPVAVVDFAMNGSELRKETNLARIIRHDLYTSGRFDPLNSVKFKQKPHDVKQVNFSYWRRIGADNLIIGKVEPDGANTYKISFSLLDVVRLQRGADKAKAQGDQVLLEKQFDGIEPAQFRSLAHHISDLVYEKLMGKPGAFSTRVAYIALEKRDKKLHYYLEVADSDGFNPQILLNSNQPIMSPVWSPDGSKLAFVSFENLRAEIYTVELATGKRKLITHYPGINGAPAWSPDGKQLAVVLSKDGAPNIYIIDLERNKMRQITKGFHKNTEPCFSPDGKTILFTSNRGGSPQLYEITLKNKKIKRVTYDGRYNVRGRYSPDGEHIVMMHRSKDKKFNIAVLKRGEDRLRLLSRTSLDESPTISPNGDMILYATYEGKQGILRGVSIDGRVKLRLPVRGASVQEPSWSPLLF